MGKGQKTIVIPKYPAADFYKFEAVTLLIEEVDGDFGTKQQLLRVKYKEGDNLENFTSWESVTRLLNEAYGVML